MKSRFLLPHSLKRIGLLLFLPCLIIGIMVLHFEFEIEGFQIAIPYGTVSIGKTIIENNLTDELAAVLMLASLILIAFSAEKEEDEWVASVRLDSLQWAVYVNYGFLLVAILFVYDIYFFEALVFNMYTILVFFILRFHYVLRIGFNPNRVTSHEK